MAVSDRDRRWLERQAEFLAEAETDEELTGEEARRVIEGVNVERRARGIPPYELPDAEDEPPEVEFYRRAKRLGMVRDRR